MLGQLFNVTFLSKKVMRLEFWQVTSPPHQPAGTIFYGVECGVESMSCLFHHAPTSLVFCVVRLLTSWLQRQMRKGVPAKATGCFGIHDAYSQSSGHMAQDHQCSLQPWRLPMPFPDWQWVQPSWSHLHTQPKDSWALDDEKLNAKCQVKSASNPVLPHGYWDDFPKYPHYRDDHKGK